MRTNFIIGNAIAIVAMMANTAGAQCAFGHPKKTKEMTLPLVQAYVPCNGDPACTPDGASRPADTATEIGVIACQSPQTYNELAGSLADGWRWGTGGYGTVSFQATTNKLVSPLNPVPNTADVRVRLDLVGVEDAFGPAEGFGQLMPGRRTTFEDRANGDMTVVDLSLPSFSVHVVNGRARLRTSANAWLNDNGFRGVPGCTSLELVRLELRDGNDTLFATPGIFLPDIN